MYSFSSVASVSSSQSLNFSKTLKLVDVQFDDIFLSI